MPPRGRTRFSAAGPRTIAGERLAAFRARFDGQLILPADREYDTARQVWNAMVDLRPAVIARPVGSVDVAEAVRFARDEGLEIAVRGGGHSPAGHSSVDNGIVIDLGAMRGVRVVPRQRRAWVQGGCRLVDIDRELSAHGLAVPAGVNWDTGIGGLTLGGGYGWLGRLYGLTVDNMLSAEVVTADGQIVRTSASHDPDLFWGLRGGGGNFGIVTWFEFRAHPVPAAVRTRDLAFDAADARVVLAAFRAMSRAAGREVTAYAGLEAATEGVPAVAPGRPVVVVGVVAIDPEADLEAITALLLAAAPALRTSDETMTFRRLQRWASEAPGARRRRYWKGHYVRDASDAFLDAFVGDDLDPDRPFYAGRELVQQGGAIADLPDDEAAFAHRDAEFDVLAIDYWDDRAEDEERIARLRAAAAQVAPFASGVYVNSLLDEGPEGVRAAYPGRRYDRLGRLKARMDPDNVFHRNANIPPAPT